MSVDTTDGPVWSQVALAGEFKGYAGGEIAFTFDRTVFDQIVANFRRHPAYRKGADGIGCADVVAWDFHHASEMPATSGSIPSEGTPSQGWVVELEARDTDGKLSLWALTRWLEPAKTYIKEKRYRWASVSVIFDAIDPVSAKNVGATLTSIALTNQPFIEGMQSLAASKGGAIAASYYYADAAMDAQDALNKIRSMLSMPETATIDEVVAELRKLSEWTQDGTTPAGVPMQDIIGALKRILNLPALSTDAEVMGEVTKLMTSLSTTEADSAESEPVEPAQEQTDMLTKIAEKLGVQANESAVFDAVSQLVDLRGVVASSNALDASSATKVVLKAQLSSDEVRAKYGAMLKALGVADADAALDKIAATLAEAEQLKAMAPELANLKARVAAADAIEEEADVEEALEGLGLSKTSAGRDSVREALLASRKASGRDAFRQKFPAKAASASLARHVSAERATERTVADNGDAPEATDVSAYTGANLTLKACEFVKASIAGADKWPWDRVHEHATALVRSKKVKG